MTQRMTLLLCPACGWCRTVHATNATASVVCGACRSPLMMLPRHEPAPHEPESRREDVPTDLGHHRATETGITEDLAAVAASVRRALTRAGVLDGPAD